MPCPRLPIIENVTATVGQRLLHPSGEQGIRRRRLSGRLHHSRSRTLYHPTAYLDPLVLGFEEAAKGAIIPVNAIAGENTLEVLWFRRSQADESKGFLPVYWPSVKATYTFQWPSTPNELILASNAGSGELSSLAPREVFTDSHLPQVGYNPNKEHGLMLAGRAMP